MRPGSSPSSVGQSVRRHGPSGGKAPPASAASAIAGATAAPWGSSAKPIIAAVESSAAGRSTAVCPRRSTSRPSSGPVIPFASAHAPATAPPAANEPVSSRVRRISTSPNADAGGRPAMEDRNSRAKPGTRSSWAIDVR